MISALGFLFLAYSFRLAQGLGETTAVPFRWESAVVCYSPLGDKNSKQGFKNCKVLMAWAGWITRNFVVQFLRLWSTHTHPKR